MKKVGEWFLNHLKLVLAILTFGITFIVIGVVMLNSFTSYKDYEAKFNANDLEVRSASAAQPTRTEIDDNYKAAYKNKLLFAADDLKVSTTQDSYLNDGFIDLTEKGGTVSLALELQEKSFVDIEFVISSEYKTKDADENEIFGVQDLLSNAGFVVNGEVMEDAVNLENSGNGPEWHHLVMAGFALPAGPVNVTISNQSGKNAMMPQIKAINFYSSQVLSIAEEAA